MAYPLTEVIRVSEEEITKLYCERLSALRDYVERLRELRFHADLPGCNTRAILSVHGRDRAGNLLATVRCTDPTVRETYTRRLRLVPSQPYSVSLSRVLRRR